LETFTMISALLLSLAVLWIVVLYRYPAYFVPRKSTTPAQTRLHPGDNWIEVVPISNHHEVSSLQEVG
jgi:hypothetical protein